MKEGARLLLVEDEELIGQLLEQVLKGGGLEVRRVSSCVEALRALRAEAFDLCLTDFMLPDGTGLEVARGAPATLKVILMSAFLEPELEAQIKVEPRVVSVLRKPMDIFELRRRVQEVLEGPPLTGDRKVAEGSPGPGSA